MSGCIGPIQVYPLEVRARDIGKEQARQTQPHLPGASSEKMDIPKIEIWQCDRWPFEG